MTDYEKAQVLRQIKAQKEGRELARKLTDMVNGGGAMESQALIDGILSEHRTLQQALFSQLVLGLIQRVANYKEGEGVDGRNEQMKQVCDTLFDALKANNMAYIDPDGKKKVYGLSFI